MIFYVFYSNFSLHDSFENAVFEHLEWLKFQKFSEDSTPKPPARRRGAWGGGLTAPI